MSSQPTPGQVLEDNAGVVVVVHYRRERDLDRTLGQFDDLPPSWDTVVVSNGTSDPGELRRVVAGHGARLIELDNLGYAAAVNAGVAASRAAQYVCVVTHEVQMADGCLDALVAKLRDDAGLGLVGPLLWDSDSPGRVWSAGGGLTRGRKIPLNNRERAVDSRKCEWIEGACWVMRSTDLQRLGGQDERYFLYMEDVDLGLRVGRELRLRVECVSNAEASQSSGGTMTTFLAVRNLLLLHRKFYPWLVPIDVVENLLRICASVVIRPTGWRERTRDRWEALVAALAGRWGSPARP